MGECQGSGIVWGVCREPRVLRGCQKSGGGCREWVLGVLRGRGGGQQLHIRRSSISLSLIRIGAISAAGLRPSYAGRCVAGGLPKTSSRARSPSPNPLHSCCKTFYLEHPTADHQDARQEDDEPGPQREDVQRRLLLLAIGSSGPPPCHPSQQGGQCPRRWPRERGPRLRHHERR